MKKYKIIVSETAEQDLENIILYLKNDLSGDIIADKYKILFKQNLKLLEDIAESVSVLDEKLTGHKDIRKLNVKNYIIFYKIDKQNNITYVVRIGYSFIDWEKYLKDL